MTRLALPLLSILALLGCEDNASNRMNDGSADMGVGQGGAQDFGWFREILLAGGIPGPEAIDDVGFFNEHYLELPPADCEQDVCIHGRLGLMGNMINGAGCTVVMIGMNTPIDPDELERPPLNLALAIDNSGSMSGDAIRYVKSGLDLMFEQLEPGDRVSLITFSDQARVAAEGTAADPSALYAAVDAMQADGGTNIYSALDLAYDVVEMNADPERQNRVLLLSDGVATIGNTSSAAIEDLATTHADDGYRLTTIGVGDDFDIDLMQALAEEGEGAFYYVEDPSALHEVFVEEVVSFLVPLAHDAVIEIDAAPGWDLRGVYGTQDVTLTGGRARIEIDTLQIAGRTSDEDSEDGRRGGGGAIVVELIPEDDAAAGAVGTLDFAYLEASSGAPVTQRVEIDSPIDPWGTEDGASYFEDAAVEKSFVMLNIYMGFEMAAESAVIDDDLDAALTVLRALSESVTAWVAHNPDADIEDDLFYIDLFIENLALEGARRRG